MKSSKACVDHMIEKTRAEKVITFDRLIELCPYSIRVLGLRSSVDNHFLLVTFVT